MFLQSISVLRPLSGIDKVNGAPALGRISFSVRLKARQSGLGSRILDDNTTPHDLQTSSPFHCLGLCLLLYSQCTTPYCTVIHLGFSKEILHQIKHIILPLINKEYVVAIDVVSDIPP